MSEEEQPMEGEQQEEQQPKNILKPEQIAAGLTQVCKTHGKFSLQQSYMSHMRALPF